MTPDQIDQAAAAVSDLVKVGAVFYPPLAPFVPIIQGFIIYEARKLKSGIADGSIVPDGRGGFVPASNSHYDPKTGRFL